MAKTLNFKLWAAVAVLAAGLFVSYAIFAHAQDATGSNDSVDEAVNHGITFPVAELGNCADKNACRTYCDDTANIDACIKFAEAHGLMNKTESSRANKFKQALQSGGGPGGCTNPRDCAAFCSDTTNLEACIKFAKDQGFKDKNVEEGEKVLKHIKSGGRMPGNCTSRESCEKYCGDFSHAEECFNFAKKAGISQARGDGGGRGHGEEPTPEQFQKFIELAKSGETPGGCTSRETCEAYCGDQAHREECVAFGEKLGFIKPEQAEMIRKSGGRGPGDCNSPESCRAYCNDQSHQEECFKFAESHGFISREEATQAKEGFVRVRAGFEDAPPEVRECLKSNLGENIIGDIQSGKLVPGPDIGERMRACFEKFGRRGDASELFKKAPPEVLACLKEKLGSQFADISSGKTPPTPEIGDTFRVCFQSVQFQGGFQGQGGPGQGGEGGRGPGAFGGAPPLEAIRRFTQTAPPEIQSCFKEQLGADFDVLQAGGDAKVDTSKLKVCFEKFQPRNFGPGGPGGQGGFPGRTIIECIDPGQPEKGFVPCPAGQGGGPAVSFDSLPPAYIDCARKLFGDAGAERLRSGQITAEEKIKLSQCVSGSTGSTDGQYPPTTGGQQPLPPTASSYADCARKLFGDEMAKRIQAGEITPDQKEQLARCVGGTSGSTGGQYPNQYPSQYPSTGGTYPPPTDGTIKPPSVLCAEKGGVWVEDKVLGRYCHYLTPEEKLQLQQQTQQYQQIPPPSGTVYPPPPTGTYSLPSDSGTYVAPPPTYVAPPPTYQPPPM